MKDDFTEYTNICCITMAPILHNEGILVRSGEVGEYTYYYLASKELLGKINECPLTRSPCLRYIELNQLNPDHMFVLLRVMSLHPRELKEPLILLL